MPIAFARVSFLNAFSDGGASRALAYLGRKAILDERLGKTFRFPFAPHDLVYDNLLLPNGAPFATVAELANAIDEAERKRQRRCIGRIRWPQCGAHLIFALPPDSVLTIDEAVELVERVVRFAIGGLSLPVYVAIHDPALQRPGSVNRHVHIFIGLREVESSGLSRKKIRDLFARPRHAAAPNVGSSYVAEGLSWPDIARDLQNGMLAEIGSDALVDPPAPFGGRHWSVKTLRHSPERRISHDQLVDYQNIGLINGSPSELVARMLRGRSLIRIVEVERLLARFLDSADDRAARLDAVLTDKTVSTFTIDPADRHPRWLTTKAVARLMRKAVAVVDRAANKRRQDRSAAQPQAPALAPALAPILAMDLALASPESNIVSALKKFLSDFPHPIHRPLILGQKHSDCREMAAALGNEKPVISTFAALSAPANAKRSGKAGRIGLRRGGVAIVPHVERVDDQDLALLLLRAKRCGARLLLGYDVGRARVSCSLAARLAEALGGNPHDKADDLAGNLRAGLVDRACRALYREGQVCFESVDHRTPGADDFVVCDDGARLASVDRQIHATGLSKDGVADTLALETRSGTQMLRVGQWIVYTANNYATEHIRAGRLAKIVAAGPPHGLKVVHADGVAVELDLIKFPHVRSAHTISIREARYAHKNANLLIELTMRENSWSAALLAASRPERGVIIHVDPSVAKNLEEWIAVVTCSKPAPLLTDLQLYDAPIAELSLLMRRIDRRTPILEPRQEKRPHNEERIVDWTAPVIELAKSMPEGAQYELPDTIGPPAAHADTSSDPVPSTPRQLDALSKTQRSRLHEDLRAALYRNSDARLALARLQSALAPRDDQADVTFDNLLRACPADGPMATLMQVLMEREDEAGPEEFSELELPNEMSARMPRAWSLWEMWQFRLDLNTMALSFSDWPMPLGPVTPGSRSVAGNERQSGFQV
jgi:hypothetical protein